MVLDDVGPMRDSVLRDEIAQTITVGLLITLLGLITIATGRPLLFPSLGPSAYLLAAGHEETAFKSDPYNVIGGHFVATVCGFIGFHLFAAGLVITEALQLPVISAPVVRLSISSVVAMILTTIGMLMTKTNHPAACATTLIVSLGLLSSLIETITIMIAVVILVTAHDYVIYPAAVKFGFEPEDPQKE
jgi:CBS-domain-containing membrane protein